MWWTRTLSVALMLLAVAEAATLPVVFAEAGPKRSSHDLLSSIEGKLSSLHSFVEAVRLSGVRSCLEHLEGRVDGVEAALGRMDTRIHSRLDKLFEMIIARDKPAVELERKLDATADKILARVAVLAARSGIPSEDVVKKMERMERNLGETMGDVLQKMARAEEKSLQMDERWTDRLECSERRVGPPTDVPGTKASNATTDRDREADLEPRPEISSGQQAVADTPLATTDSESLWRNVSTTLDDALLVGRKKFHELDEDIEMYTRKVLNAYQELLKESKGIEDYLNKVIDHDNQTRTVVREGFRKLFHQMKPLSNLEEILQSLRKKVAEMGSTVDTSFASLLVAQNTFIATCHRIQNQEPQIETKIYHLLQKLMAQVDERSGRQDCPETNETTLLRTLESHRKDVGKAMHDLVWMVITVGNQTSLELQRAVDQFRLSTSRLCTHDDDDDETGAKQLDGAKTTAADQQPTSTVNEPSTTTTEPASTATVEPGGSP